MFSTKFSMNLYLCKQLSSQLRNELVILNYIKVTGLNRKFHCCPINYAATGKLQTNQRPDWNRAVTEAEKVVGYPTSFLSLRWLLSDEIANVALHLRKLVGSNHPLLKTAKSFLYNGRNNMHAWGLIVLLISKAAGHINVPDMEEDKAAGVLHSQRALAEVTEMIRTSNLVHRALVNVYPGSEPTEAKDMAFGNKIALLSGDYLLCNSSAELAALRNQDVVLLMSTAIRDLSEGEFFGRRDKQNNPLPGWEEGVTGSAVSDWTHRHILTAGSLLGRSCQGSLRLANHPVDIQLRGYEFGKHLALAWQAFLDLEPFIGTSYNPGQMFSLTCAPVLFHLEQDKSLQNVIDLGRHDVHSIDYAKVHSIVSKGPGVEMTQQLQREHSSKALNVLSSFKESDARTALRNIILAMGEL